MQEVDDTWKNAALYFDGVYEVRATIGGVTYGMDTLVSVSTPRQVFNSSTPTIGSAVSAEIDMEILLGEGATPPPRAAKITLEMRVFIPNDPNHPEPSAWVPKGTYYIDSRKYDETGTVLTLHGYDAMQLTEAVYLDKYGSYDNEESWPRTAKSIVADIADAIGSVVPMNTLQGSVTYPGNYTMREMLQHIGAANGGNFVMDEYNQLKFVPLSVSIYQNPVQNLRENCAAFSRDESTGKFTEVTLTGGEEDRVAGTYESGSFRVSATCPWATQADADRALDVIKNWNYLPFEATDTLLDPAVELGDMVEVNGYRVIVCKIERTLDKMSTANISAPTDEELGHEYPYLFGGYKGNHALPDAELANKVAGLDKKFDSLTSDFGDLSTDFDGLNTDLNSVKALANAANNTAANANNVAQSATERLNEMSIGRTLKLEFDKWSQGSFTETIGTDAASYEVNYVVQFGTTGEPIKIVSADGHALEIVWSAPAEDGGAA